MPPNENEIVFSGHALRRCFERGLAPDAITKALQNGQTIREYPDDRPYPSRLVLTSINERPVHAVIAGGDEQLIVVTVYEPDPALWNEAFTERRTR